MIQDIFSISFSTMAFFQKRSSFSSSSFWKSQGFYSWCVLTYTWKHSFTSFYVLFNLHDLPLQDFNLFGDELLSIVITFHFMSLSFTLLDQCSFAWLIYSTWNCTSYITVRRRLIFKVLNLKRMPSPKMFVMFYKDLDWYPWKIWLLLMIYVIYLVVFNM